MARWRGNTTERGYGHAHQKARAQAIAAWRPGDRCARCRRPLDGNPANMDLGHIDGTSKRMYAGLEHRSCNRAAAHASRTGEPRPRRKRRSHGRRHQHAGNGSHHAPGNHALAATHSDGQLWRTDGHHGQHTKHASYGEQG